ncbi:hypothetical protein [Streptomyces lushanensis]|uniref:hypothetical protein n=1 Tax=Streptomyces lushanensis TaxID=1434255 RepID=UPI000836C130|nr:hypothetical protein [Streptomyces lushanensis]
MQIQFVGIDPDTDEDGCPTVWVDTGTSDLLIQSYTADDESTAECHALSPAKAPIPPTETVIRIPQRMVPIIRKACDELDGIQ